MMELEPDRLDELAALVAHHMEEGGEALEAARWSARAAYWAGSSQPSEALRLWRRTMELVDRLDESDETASLAVSSASYSCSTPGASGMGQNGEPRLVSEAEEIAPRTGDLHSLALLRLATAARPGMPHIAQTWLAAISRNRPASPTNGATRCRW